MKRTPIQVLEAEIDACRVCARSKTALLKPLGIDRGNPSAKVMMVGLAPGASATNARLAFAGHSMTKLTRWFDEAGYPLSEDNLRAKLYMTSINKCGAVPDTANHRRSFWKRCRTFLSRQIELVRPRLICTLGGEAAGFLLPFSGDDFIAFAGSAFDTADVNVGHLFPFTTHDCRWIALPHPSGLSRVMNLSSTRDRILTSLATELDRAAFGD